MASKVYDRYQQQQLKKQRPWMRDNNSLVAVNPERIVTLFELAVEHYGKNCARCGSKKALTVHHRHYRQNGFEKPVEDIVLLCHSCHQDLHKRGKEKRLNREDIPYVDPKWADWLQGIAPYTEPDEPQGQLAGVDPNLIRKWKVVYRDRDGQEWVSLDYYVTKEDVAEDCTAGLALYDLAEVASIEDVTDSVQTYCGCDVIPLEPHQESIRSHPKYLCC